jgi:hypothetical protein
LAALTNLIWENCSLCVSASHLPRNALTLRSSGLIIIQSGLEGRSIIDTIPIPDEKKVRFNKGRKAPLHARGRKHRAGRSPGR